MGNLSELTSEQAGRGWLEHTVSSGLGLSCLPQKIIQIGKLIFKHADDCIAILDLETRKLIQVLVQELH